RDARDEVEDRRFGCAIVPGRQRIALRLSLRRGGAKRGREQGKQSQGREQDAAIDNRKTNDRLHVASLQLPSGRTGTRRARPRSFNARRLLTSSRPARLYFRFHRVEVECRPSPPPLQID